MIVCDACGRPAEYTLDVRGAQMLDLCEEHWEEFVEDYLLADEEP